MRIFGEIATVCIQDSCLMRNGVGNYSIPRLGDYNVYGPDEILIVSLDFPQETHIVYFTFSLPGRYKEKVTEFFQFAPRQTLQPQATKTEEHNGRGLR